MKHIIGTAHDKGAYIVMLNQFYIGQIRIQLIINSRQRRAINGDIVNTNRRQLRLCCFYPALTEGHIVAAGNGVTGKEPLRTVRIRFNGNAIVGNAQLC